MLNIPVLCIKRNDAALNSSEMFDGKLNSLAPTPFHTKPEVYQMSSCFETFCLQLGFLKKQGLCKHDVCLLPLTSEISCFSKNYILNFLSPQACKILTFEISCIISFLQETAEMVN